LLKVFLNIFAEKKTSISSSPHEFKLSVIKKGYIFLKKELWKSLSVANLSKLHILLNY